MDVDKKEGKGEQVRVALRSTSRRFAFWFMFLQLESPSMHVRCIFRRMLAVGSALSAAWMLYDRGRAAASAAAQLSKWISSMSPEVDVETLAALTTRLESADLRIEAIRPALNFLVLWSRDKGSCVHGLVFMTREVLQRVDELIRTCLRERDEGEGPTHASILAFTGLSASSSSSSSSSASNSSSSATQSASGGDGGRDPVTLRNNRMRALLLALQVTLPRKTRVGKGR